VLEGLRRVAHEPERPFLAYLIAPEEANTEKARRD
jgi:hypothetical protein